MLKSKYCFIKQFLDSIVTRKRPHDRFNNIIDIFEECYGVKIAGRYEVYSTGYIGNVVSGIDEIIVLVGPTISNGKTLYKCHNIIYTKGSSITGNVLVINLNPAAIDSADLDAFVKYYLSLMSLKKALPTFNEAEALFIEKSIYFHIIENFSALILDNHESIPKCIAKDLNRLMGMFKKYSDDITDCYKQIQ